MRFSRVGLALVALAAGLIGVVASQAQEPSLAVDVVSVADGEYPGATAIVTIEDSSADTAAVHGAGDFTVTLDGAPAAVTSAALAKSEDAPLYVLFVIDSSGSMDGAPIAAAKNAAKAFVSELHENDLVGVLDFGNAVTLSQDFTNDRALINAAIDGVVAQGNTALYQATSDAAAKIAAAPSSRRAVVLLSDGADFGGKSVATREQALSSAAGTGVPYFVVAQGTDLDRPYLQQLADVTRGHYLEAPQPQELEALYVGIGRMLRSQYVVTFDASGVTPGVTSTVSVTVRDGERVSSPSEATYTPSASFLPQITIEGVQADEEIRQARQLTLSVSAGSPRVAWYIDGVNVAENEAPPYVFTYEPSLYAEGAHTLKVSLGSGPGAIEQSLAFSSVPPAPLPEDGGPPVVLIASGVVGLLAAIGSVFWFRSRRPRKEAGISPDQRVTPWATQVARKAQGDTPDGEADDMTPEDIGEPLGLLIARGGSEIGKEYLVGGKPVGIGAGPRCGVRINDGELSFEEARVWVRGEHLMLRKKTRLSRLEAIGEVGGWQILDVGDTFEVGAHRFEFKLLPQTQPSPSTADGEPQNVPNVLRTPEPQPPPPQPRFSDLMPRND